MSTRAAAGPQPRPASGAGCFYKALLKFR
jgi:hypothetical protein